MSEFSEFKPLNSQFLAGTFVSSWLDSLGLDPFEFRIYAHLCRRIGDENRVNEGTEAIARSTGISPRKTVEVMNALENTWGLIARVPRIRAKGGRAVNDTYVLGMAGYAFKHNKTLDELFNVRKMLEKVLPKGMHSIIPQIAGGVQMAVIEEVEQQKSAMHQMQSGGALCTTCTPPYAPHAERSKKIFTTPDGTLAVNPDITGNTLRKDIENTYVFSGETGEEKSPQEEKSVSQAEIPAMGGKKQTNKGKKDSKTKPLGKREMAVMLLGEELFSKLFALAESLYVVQGKNVMTQFWTMISRFLILANLPEWKNGRLVEVVSGLAERLCSPYSRITDPFIYLLSVLEKQAQNPYSGPQNPQQGASKTSGGETDDPVVLSEFEVITVRHTQPNEVGLYQIWEVVVDKRTDKVVRKIQLLGTDYVLPESEQKDA